MTTRQKIINLLLALTLIAVIGILGGIERRNTFVEDTIYEMGEKAYYGIHAYLEDSLDRPPTRSEIADYYISHGRDKRK